MTDLIPFIIEAILVVLAVYLLIFKIFGLRVINSNEVAVVEKWWSTKGSLKGFPLLRLTVKQDILLTYCAAVSILNQF